MSIWKEFFFCIIIASLPLLFAESVSIDRLTAGADHAATIQAAVDGCKAGDCVRLGEGVYTLSAELMITNGVTLAGAGWDKTVLRQTAPGARVVTLDGGAKVERVTLTGGRRTGKNYGWGGGACVLDGAISWCCVTNNQLICSGHNAYGGGIGFPEHGKGQVDHSLIVDNVCSAGGGSAPDSYGGGIGVYKPDGAVMIDTCLIRANHVLWKPAQRGCGGGIGLNYIGTPVVIRNTTIVENCAGEEGAETAASGGGVYLYSNWCKQKVELVNCIIASNVTIGDDENDTTLLDTTVVNSCLFDRAADRRGEHSITGDPRFKNPAAGKFTLMPTSPAWKAGRTYQGIGLDLAGRDFAEPPSMGCYELFSGFSVVFR